MTHGVKLGIIITLILQIKSFHSVVNNEEGVGLKQGSRVGEEDRDIQREERTDRKIRGVEMKFSHAHILKL